MGHFDIHFPAASLMTPWLRPGGHSRFPPFRELHFDDLHSPGLNLQAGFDQQRHHLLYLCLVRHSSSFGGQTMDRMVYKKPLHCSVQECAICRDNFPTNVEQLTTRHAYKGRVNVEEAEDIIQKHAASIQADRQFLKETLSKSGDAVSRLKRHSLSSSFIQI